MTGKGRKEGQGNPGAGASHSGQGMRREPARVRAPGVGGVWERWTEEGSVWGPGGPRKCARTMDVRAQGPGWETVPGVGGAGGAEEPTAGTGHGLGAGAGPRRPARVWSAQRSSRGPARPAGFGLRLIQRRFSPPIGCCLRGGAGLRCPEKNVTA